MIETIRALLEEAYVLQRAYVEAEQEYEASPQPNLPIADFALRMCQKLIMVLSWVGKSVKVQPTS